MKAIVHYGKTGYEGLAYTDYPEPVLKAQEVKIRLKTAGLNHRDLFVLVRHQPDAPPIVIGSDGAGIIEEIGEGVTSFQKGDEVVVIPSLGWEKNTPAPPEGFEILGLPDDGTFAEFIVLPELNVAKKPAHLSWEEAGVLSLGAVTAYRALFTKGQIQEGDTVFIPGIGSGVAILLLKMAKAVGARVIVTSRYETKRQKALELGADLVLSSQEDWVEALKNETIDLVIDSVGAATFQKSLNVLKKGGRIVIFGASAGDSVDFNLRDFFYGQYQLLGSTMGSIEEFHDMLEFISKHDIAPMVDTTYPLEACVEAMRRLEEGEQFGKIAFTVS
ncbi:zinc-binding dehydrogenase [Pullulanibacillus sp. KACC 23026]|uniref:zinc-binding dehydrogenase n=1 Tax=Pullulanibacillus sp. KACC 23026 TaxID=3028315 RepID=UPI0023B1439E|nr:zinc-binding dehydrogenase [Pullulanibacillus sp. KACC 23026]WEG12266.1 zinc-binding dehydrogenase [Pullulanibacillus sp. KACC 23026]